jgi:cobalt/nickel transport system permease protein
MTTPAWLLEREPGLCPCGCVGKRRKGSYLEKTLRGSAGLLRQVMFSDELAHRPGLLQRLDPRAKVVGFLGLLVAASFVRSPWMLLACYLATLVMAAVSRLPVLFFIQRAWLFIPLFTGIVVLPATLSLVTPGEVILTIWQWNGEPQGFTTQGLRSAAVLVLRVAGSVSLVVLLTLTTPWSRLLAGLRGLGVPKMFILVIGMAYRYLFHLLTSVMDMYEARKARSIGKQAHDRAARKFVAATAGALIGKSHYLAEEVHQAMTARGFRGDIKVLDRFRLGLLEAGWLAGVTCTATLALGGDTLLVR